jgi:transposase
METLKDSKFFSAQEVSKMLDVSISSAYRIIRELNYELKNNGKIIISGKISKRYFEEKLYM